MDNLEKLISEGWWDKSSVDVDWEELLEERETSFIDLDGSKVILRIPSDKPTQYLTEKDLEIIRLPSRM